MEDMIDGNSVGWFTPTYKMLTDVWRDISTMMEPVIESRNVAERRISLITGGTLDMWSMDNPDAGRGRKYSRVIIDEAAMVKDLMYAWNASIRPTLTDYKGDAWFFSTPKGRNGFWQMWQLGQDEQEPEWQSWQMPTVANPYIDPDEVEAARRQLPERIFAQEYLAQFLEDAGGVFRRVMDAATATEREPDPNAQYTYGVDWGKHNDFTVIVVLDEAGSMVAMDRFNQIDYAFQTQRLETLAARYTPRTVVAERNSMGEPIIEQLQRSGLPVSPFTTTNASKAQAIEALALAFERGDISILPDPVLVGELQAFEAARLPSGMLRYGAPAGMHDDCVMALALAWQGQVEPTWLLF